MSKKGLMTRHPHLNYDTIAPKYNQRYASSPLPERANALIDLIQQVKAQRILEVGCGTGFWLNAFSAEIDMAYGMDYSMGMLEQAKRRSAHLELSRGDAVYLPYRDNSFDFLYCVDAIHHFGKPDRFIAEAFHVLQPGGALAVVGSDPHGGDGTWYVYDYFEGVLETDLQRFPSESAILAWMRKEGFQNISSKGVEHISDVYVGMEVFNDPFLKKNSCSQLALLNDEAHQAGLEKIKAAVAREEQVVFRNELFIKMFTGFKS
jgi:SAM-dependent methyltransferase